MNVSDFSPVKDLGTIFKTLNLIKNLYKLHKNKLLQLFMIIHINTNRFRSPCFVPLAPQHASISVCSHLRRNTQSDTWKGRSDSVLTNIHSDKQQERVFRSHSEEVWFLFFSWKVVFVYSLQNDNSSLKILTFTLEEENSRKRQWSIHLFVSLWIRGYWLKCLCLLSSLTIDRAELPLMSAGEDFFIQSFSLLELALFQVTGRLKNTENQTLRVMKL